MTGTATLAWAIAAGMGAVAIALFFRLRSMSVEINEAVISSEKLAGELQASRAQLEREAAKQRRKGDELADLRKRHDKLKKRKGAEEAGAPAAGSESGGAASERELEDTRQARDRAREESSALASELEASRAALVKAIAASRPAEGVLSPVDAEALRNESKRATDALDELRGRAEKAEDQVARLKKKLDSHELAYVQLRGELEAKKDRLTTQNEQLERLRSFKVALVDASDDEPATLSESESESEPESPDPAEAESTTDP